MSCAAHWIQQQVELVQKGKFEHYEIRKTTFREMVFSTKAKEEKNMVLKECDPIFLPSDEVYSHEMYRDLNICSLSVWCFATAQD